MYDCDKAAARCSRMWKKLGMLLEERAYDAAQRGLRVAAMECAKAADACYWQATGENESIDFDKASS